MIPLNRTLCFDGNLPRWDDLPRSTRFSDGNFPFGVLIIYPILRWKAEPKTAIGASQGVDAG